MALSHNSGRRQSCPFLPEAQAVRTILAAAEALPPALIGADDLAEVVTMLRERSLGVVHMDIAEMLTSAAYQPSFVRRLGRHGTTLLSVGRRSSSSAGTVAISAWRNGLEMTGMPRVRSGGRLA